MNQPRYSDSGGGGGVGYSDNRRSTHATGRSNFGGGGGRANRGRRGGKGPIGNWIQNRRQRRARRQRSSNGGAVGTEANAIQNMAKNAGFFNYPAEGFVTPIEHSLLYAMIEYPERYPESVVKKEIEDEEFDVYMYFNSEKRKNNSDGGGGGGSDNRQQESEENETGEAEEGVNEDEGGHTQADDEDEGRVSYAQLSALAALSAEKNPSTASNDQDMPAANRTAASKNRNSSNNTEGRSGGGNSTDNKDSGGGQSVPEEQISVGQALVRKLLRTITRYSDAHGLDRQTEIREFLAPIEKRCQLRNEKAALQQLLPAYAGYTLSLVTGNPLPLLIGAAALAGPDPMNEENGNVSNFRAVGSRAGDMETAGLLDECESD